MGKKSINSDAYFEIEGHADLAKLCKQFWPASGPVVKLSSPAHGPLVGHPGPGEDLPARPWP
jgi:hypothetical protein